MYLAKTLRWLLFSVRHNSKFRPTALGTHMSSPTAPLFLVLPTLISVWPSFWPLCRHSRLLPHSAVYRHPRFASLCQLGALSAVKQEKTWPPWFKLIRMLFFFFSLNKTKGKKFRDVVVTQQRCWGTGLPSISLFSPLRPVGPHLRSLSLRQCICVPADGGREKRTVAF